MECVHGAQRLFLDQHTLDARTTTFPYLWVDLGAGDGRFVIHLARTLPRWFVVGVDACREPLRTCSRKAEPNSLFAIANAGALPPELNGRAHRVSINFPWGSLLHGLIEGDAGLFTGLQRISKPDSLLEIRLNGGAIKEAGITAEAVTERVGAVLTLAGWDCAPPIVLKANQLRALPSSWARKLVHGPHPWAIELRAVKGRVRESAALPDITTLEGDLANARQFPISGKK
jgi:16S rRNA (adenine(1408)-N(1))-methyltransferase